MVTKFFDNNPPDFYQVPFSFHDPDTIRSLLSATEFNNVQLTVLPLAAIAVSARDIAKGLIHGQPIVTPIMERAKSSVSEIQAALAAEIARKYGNGPVRAKMRALFCTAGR